MNLKLKDALVIAFGVVLGLLVAAGPAEFIRMAVMQWDIKWYKHANDDCKTFSFPVCPDDDSPVGKTPEPAKGPPINLKKGDTIRFFDPNERKA